MAKARVVAKPRQPAKVAAKAKHAKRKLAATATKAAPKPATKPLSKSATKPAPKAAASAKAGPDPLLAQYWDHPEDTELLRVWADSLSERGDLRGEYIQLSLLPERTPEQEKRRISLDKQHHGKLAGPAREYLREFELGPNGLVHAARCEADKLVDGIHAIEWLNPTLALKVTSLKEKGVVDRLAKLSLERIYHVGFTWGIVGSQGGSPMTDAQLITLAPAFRRVRHLSFDCGGYGDNCFTPEGLRVLGNTVEALEYLAITYDNRHARPYQAQTRQPLPPMADYARVIATAPGFKTLKVVFLRGNDTGQVSPDVFSALPNLVYAETAPDDTEGSWQGVYDHPTIAVEIEAAKRGVRVSPRT